MDGNFFNVSTPKAVYSRSVLRGAVHVLRVKMAQASVSQGVYKSGTCPKGLLNGSEILMS